MREESIIIKDGIDITQMRKSVKTVNMMTRALNEEKRTAVTILNYTTRKIKPCRYCLGTGKLKDMQSVATSTESTRGIDKEVKCKYCSGTGLSI